MKGKIIAVANQKGGSTKTTTSAAIVSGATYHGKKALAVDFDSQCNLTFIMGGDPSGPGSFDLIQGENPNLIIQHTDQGDLIPGNISLAGADSTLQGNDRIYALRNALSALKKDYSVIVIDCPPSLSTLLINALTAADGVIIPMLAKMTNLQGLYLLSQSIRTVQEQYNPQLKIYGILFTEYSGRTIAARNVAETIRKTAKELKIPIFKTAIRAGVAVEESQILQQSLFVHAPKSNPAQDYLEFLAELKI